MTLHGASLHAEWLQPGRPPPLCTSNEVSNDCLLFVDLPANVDKELLRTYASKAAEVDVNRITFSSRPGVALVHYSAPVGSSQFVIELCVC